MISTVLEIIRKTGMIKNVTFLSSSVPIMQTILDKYEKARLGLLGETCSTELIDNAETLKNEFNDVFINVNYTTLTNELAIYSLQKDIEVEVWTWDNSSSMVVPTVNKGVSGITSDSLNILEILKESI